MATQLTWLGHGSWLIETGGHTLLLDPYLDDAPTSPLKSADVSPQYILVSHGHFDHVNDVAKIARRCDASVIAVWEICEWLNKQGIKKTIDMNTGGGMDLPFGRVKLTIAQHSSTLPDGSPAGNPVGFLLTLEEKNVYFACDTALFMDMQLIGRVGLELAVLPIGDRYTMGPEDSLEAINLLQPKRVAPAHYNTWPPIAQDAQAWARRVKAETEAEPIVLEPGGKIVL